LLLQLRDERLRFRQLLILVAKLFCLAAQLFFQRQHVLHDRVQRLLGQLLS
jgi:hypothetical protein